MALRTVITPQNLSAMAGQAITFQSIDTVNGMQVKNTGSQVILIRTAAGETITVNFPSQVDAFNRLGDLGGSQSGLALKSYGPFLPEVNWGDAAAQLYIDASGSSGNPQVAVVTVI